MPENIIHLQQSMQKQALNDAIENFLASVEQRAYKTALLTTRNKDDALDIVQDAMTKLVQKYRNSDEAQWPLLFQRILQHCVVDWLRLSSERHVGFGKNLTKRKRVRTNTKWPVQIMITPWMCSIDTAISMMSC